MQALENDHNVYILGAGFSAGAGLPLMRDFLARMRDSLDWLNEKGRKKDFEAVAHVLQFRLEAASAAYRTPLDLENIEELFSLASASGDHLPPLMQRAIAATVDYAVQTSQQVSSRTRQVAYGPVCELRDSESSTASLLLDGKNFDLSAGYDRLYVTDIQVLVAGLAGLLSAQAPGRANTFITFNYDLLVEESLVKYGLEVDYGFEVPFPQATDKRVQPRDVSVLKLHGSINWTWSEDREAVEIGNGYDPNREGPLIVPPTWRKDFALPFGSVWEAALKALRTATRIVVLGFSMPSTDQHFRYLLAAGLRNNISLRRIVIADPNIEAVQQKAAGIFRPELSSQGIVTFLRAPAFDMINAKSLGLIGRPLAQGVVIGA